MSNKRFRISAKNLFLTYSQVHEELTCEEVLCQLKLKVHVNHYLIAREHHKKEGVHIHVLLELHSKCDTRDSSYLDITYKGKVFHGNYQRVRNKQKVQQYIVKDGNFIKNAEYQVFIKKGTTNVLITIEEHILELARKEGVRNALKTYISLATSVALKNIERLRKNITSILKIEEKEEQEWPFTLSDFNPSSFPEELQLCKGPEDYNKLLKVPLVLNGRSGLGKTLFAKSLCQSLNKTLLVVKSMERIEAYDKHTHDVLLWDDANVQDVFKKEQDFISFLDASIGGSGAQIRHLYGYKTLQDVPIIMTTNSLKQLIPVDSNNILPVQLARRLNIINITKPIQLNINVDNSTKIIFNQHNNYYNNHNTVKKNSELFNKENS